MEMDAIVPIPCSCILPSKCRDSASLGPADSKHIRASRIVRSPSLGQPTKSSSGVVTERMLLDGKQEAAIRSSRRPSWRNAGLSPRCEDKANNHLCTENDSDTSDWPGDCVRIAPAL